jgi:hypothetical protein
MANPIPFAYYHLMNVILVFNIMLLATFSGLFRSYASVFPFAVALLVYMGLREISTALADPFGRDSIDFPVPDFMRTCFDSAVCQLLAFSRADVRERILWQINRVEDFHDHHLRRSTKPSMFSADDEPMKGTATIIRWIGLGIFEDAKKDLDIVKKMKYSFTLKEFHSEAEGPKITPPDPFRLQKKEAIKGYQQEIEVQKDLKEQLDALDAEYAHVMEQWDTLIDRYPELHSTGAAVEIPEELGEDVAERLALAAAAEKAEAGEDPDEEPLPVDVEARYMGSYV